MAELPRTMAEGWQQYVGSMSELSPDSAGRVAAPHYPILPCPLFPTHRWRALSGPWFFARRFPDAHGTQPRAKIQMSGSPYCVVVCPRPRRAILLPHPPCLRMAGGHNLGWGGVSGSRHGEYTGQALETSGDLTRSAKSFGITEFSRFPGNRGGGGLRGGTLPLWL
eukprot:gene14425-biopygen6584